MSGVLDQTEQIWAPATECAQGNKTRAVMFVWEIRLSWDEGLVTSLKQVESWDAERRACGGG